MSMDGNADARRLSTRQRRRAILDLLQEHDFVATSELAERFDITDVSVRRDLAELARRGSLLRVRGGAVPVRGAAPAQQRQTEHVAQKRRIGAVAATLIKPASVVFVDGGSTTIEVVRALPEGVRSSITIVTHSLPVLETVARWPVSRLVSLGGTYVEEHEIFAGPQTVATIERLSADVAIVGCDGLSADGGLTTPHELAGEVIAAMVGRARSVIVVADAGKVGRRGFTPVAPTSVIGAVVTDAAADANEVDALRASGVDVRVA